MLKLLKTKTYMEKIHKWSKNDAIITFYTVKFGLKGLPVKDVKDLAEGVIGTTIASFDMQSANVRFLMGYDEGTLEHHSEMQEKVVNEYCNTPVEDLRSLVVSIIDKSNYNDNLKKIADRKKAIEAEKKRKAQKLADDNFFRSLGKDPSKMKRK